jgi:hypothetical protein
VILNINQAEKREKRRKNKNKHQYEVEMSRSYWHTEASAQFEGHFQAEHSSADWDISPHELEMTGLLHHIRAIPPDHDHTPWWSFALHTQSMIKEKDLEL